MGHDARGPVLVVVGPTAVGKSACALLACERFGGEIVSVDSMQVYRGLDAATSKPDAAERRRVPHHGIDVAEPGADYSLGEFVRAAEQAIDSIRRRTLLPVLVGGTGLYLRGLLKGIADAPRRDELIRERLRKSAGNRGVAHLHRMLMRVDPEAAGRLGPQDRQRVVRALEVFFATRRGLSDWIRESPFGEDRFDAVKIGLNMDREALYCRIDARVTRFYEGGLIEEVRRLLAERTPRTANAFKALGYKECLGHLDGDLSLDQAIDLTRRNTRRYAKRQLTWFRREPHVDWFDVEPADPKPFTKPLMHAERQLRARGYRWNEATDR